MKTPGVRVSRQSFPNSNKGAEQPPRFRQAGQPGAFRYIRNLAAPPSWQKCPNLLRTFIGTSPPVSVRPRLTALSQTRGIATLVSRSSAAASAATTPDCVSAAIRHHLREMPGTATFSRVLTKVLRGLLTKRSGRVP